MKELLCNIYPRALIVRILLCLFSLSPLPLHICLSIPIFLFIDVSFLCDLEVVKYDASL